MRKISIFIAACAAFIFQGFAQTSSLEKTWLHATPIDMHEQWYHVQLRGLVPKHNICFSFNAPSAYRSSLVMDTQFYRLDKVLEHSQYLSREWVEESKSYLDVYKDSICIDMSFRLAPGASHLKFSLYPLLKSKEGFSTTELNYVIARTEFPQLLPEQAREKKSSWIVFLLAFAGGLVALLTPCVYSMIPITVGFFSKKSGTRKNAIKNALYYSSSIVLIFTLLGFLITLIFGASVLNAIATHWIANLIFFLVFILFGFSFLGAFEIQLPASWSTNLDRKSKLGNFAGLFFMALTLVVVSFSCTGPIIGNLIVLAAQGKVYDPLIGMFGFSLALAIPFFLFALFPSWLNRLGKSGSWLNTIKVSLGFLEIALAFKFFSNADLAMQWRILDREVFLAIWSILFILLGVYLLGGIRFHHDNELQKNDYGQSYLSIPRLFFATSSLVFALYLIPGMWGAPLKGVAAFLPTYGTQDFVLSPSSTTPKLEVQTQEKIKYADAMAIYEPQVVKQLHLPVYFDYAQALQASQQQKKPILLDFTGINCINCRKMETAVWSNPEVARLLRDSFLIASLYIDVHSIYLDQQLGSTQMPETMGDHNVGIQIHQYQSNVQPYYFFINERDERLIAEGYAYDASVEKFLDLLRRALKKYHQ